MKVGESCLPACALQRFLERASTVEPRARAAAVPAFARPVVVARLAGSILEVRQLHLLPQPVDDVVDLELEGVLDAAVLVAAAAAAAALRGIRARVDAVAGPCGALADAFDLVRRTQPESVVLEHPHRHAHRRAAAGQHVGAGDHLRQVGANGVADLLVVAQPVARAAREQVVPGTSDGCR